MHNNILIHHSGRKELQKHCESSGAFLNIQKRMDCLTAERQLMSRDFGSNKSDLKFPQKSKSPGANLISRPANRI